MATSFRLMAGRCMLVWEKAGANVTRPVEKLDPALIFPVSDHMGSARKFFYIKAARDWLFRQVKG